MNMKMTEKLFRAVKIMTQGGATADEISEYFNISTATVGRVRASETFDEYKQIMSVRAIKAKEKTKPQEPEKAPEPQIIEHRQTVTIQATHYMMEELKKQNETLELISRKLTELIDIWSR